MGIRNFLSGGNEINEQMVDQVYDYQAKIHDAEAKVYQESGYMSDSEANAYLEQALSQNDKDHEKAASDMRAVSNQNICINLAGIAMSGLGAFGATSKAGTLARTLNAEGKVVGGMVGKANSMLSNAFSKTSGLTGLQRVGNAVGGATLWTGGEALRLYNSGMKGLSNLGRSCRSGTGFLMANGTKLAIIAAPTAAAQLYTRSRTDEISSELTDTIDTLNDQYTSIMANRESLNGKMGKVYTDWAEGYEKGSAELARRLENGEITQAEFDSQYEQFTQDSNDRLKEMNKEFPEMGRYIVENGSAANMADYMMKHNIDPDVVTDRSEYVDKIYQQPENKDELDRAQEHHELYEATDKGDGFSNFISSIHATILHYLPVMAYAEAFVTKGIDVAMEFADNYIPGFDYNEKYENKGIGEIASSISDSAEADFVAKQEMEDLENGTAEREQSDTKTEQVVLAGQPEMA